MDYWTNFTKTLDANGTGLPLWKSLAESDKGVMDLDQSVGMRPRPPEAQIDFLQAHSTE